MLTVHHLGVSQSDRIVWLCEELDIPYELIVYQRDPATRLAPAEYKALHPSETAPVITDGDLVLGESGAIVDYILARYGGGRLSVDSRHPDFAAYLYWFHFANGSMMPRIMTELLISRMGEDAGEMMRAFGARAVRAFEMVEERLASVSYLAGDMFTAADVMMLFPLTTMRMFAPRDLQPYPNIRQYLQRIGGRPAYRRALERGDPGLVPMLS